ncbi:hypothetical protein FHP05_04890 [Cerasibacillus terrae]|uniref:LXG domain-containing protein n=1 Tax=Cerasibacillus terrae TaxID=2498845 RepID=A0A5C8P0A6_9BACI|nr:T7SS effector LXG polymorphic toxin [Cerasibacillus terrae]TXL66723.1 hypothetical protein FHP05_04890 [Cerasibacillus terrae]
MKVLDVNVLQSGMDDTITDIDNLQGRISALQRAVRDFAGLDDALSGKGGEAIRAFYDDCHQPFLIFLHQSLIDYQNTLTELKEAVETFEPDENGYVSQEFLENDVKNGLDEVKTTAIDLTSEANSIIGSVQDIVSIEKIDESEVVDNVQRGKDKADHIVDELNILDEYGVSQLEQTKQDLDTMLSYLTEIESKFQSGDLSIRNFDVKAIQGLESFQTIQDSIYNKNQETISGLYGDDIEKMPMSEIEKMQASILSELSEDGKATLNHAFNALENGEINRKQYQDIVLGLQRFERDIEEGNLDASVDPAFFEYFRNNYKNIGINAYADIISSYVKEAGKNSVEVGKHGIRIGDLIKEFPVGKNFFTKTGDIIKRGGDFIVLTGRNIQGAGLALGVGSIIGGYGLGMYHDLKKKDKSVGEAIAHNTASLGVGLGTNTLAMAAFGTNPGGWAILGGIAVGTILTTTFNYWYEINLFDLQDGLDWVGGKIDETWKKTKEVISNVGEAISGGIDAINPMNWAW